MMKDIFLQKAIENLKAAEVLFELDLFNASANRAYYAVFHVATFYLLLKGFSPSISHRNVLSMFVNEFINKKKIFPLKFKNIFYKLQIERNNADYGISISKSVSKKQLKNATIFVKIILNRSKDENKS